MNGIDKSRELRCFFLCHFHIPISQHVSGRFSFQNMHGVSAAFRMMCVFLNIWVPFPRDTLGYFNI
jgi:hypothetical protein